MHEKEKYRLIMIKIVKIKNEKKNTRTIEKNPKFTRSQL